MEGDLKMGERVVGLAHPVMVRPSVPGQMQMVLPGLLAGEGERLSERAAVLATLTLDWQMERGELTLRLSGHRAQRDGSVTMAPEWTGQCALDERAARVLWAWLDGVLKAAMEGRT